MKKLIATNREYQILSRLLSNIIREKEVFHEIKKDWNYFEKTNQ